jgi:NAD(P)-dependent dehydrogenase (short-subunit alcohol dehydrogenase family)
MPIDLRGKTALVTGASRGIGKSISLSLARLGVHTILSARSLPRLERVAEEIEKDSGRATILTADLSKVDDILLLFLKIREQFNGLDIAVHNAGIGYFEELVDFPVDKFDEIVEVNMRGTFLCCQQAMKIMIPARAGYIINISSVQGIKGYPKHAAYAASKHGIIGMTKSLAAEAQKHNIRVSAILPGAVDTELITDARPDLDRSNLIHPEDISKSVLFLLSVSERARFDMLVIRRSASTHF